MEEGYNPAAELVVIVDQEDRELGVVTRREMRRQNLIHRASYVLVFNRAGELFVQKRTRTKDVFPGYWDVATGGVVLAGEGYEESAARELAEELGVEGVRLEPLFANYYEDSANRVHGRVFRCLSEGPFILQPEEVEDGRFISLAEVFERGAREHFTPDGMAILQRLADSSQD